MGRFLAHGGGGDARYRSAGKPRRGLLTLSLHAPRLAVIVFQQLTSNQTEYTVVCRLGQPACKKNKKRPVFVEEGGGFAHSPVQKSLSFPNNNHIRSTVTCSVSPLWYPVIHFTAPQTRNELNLFVFFYTSEKNAVAHNVIHVTMAHVVFSNKDTMHSILVSVSLYSYKTIRRDVFVLLW